MRRTPRAKSYVPIIAIILIGLGAALTFHFAAGAIGAYRSVEFAAQHDFHTGDLDVELVRPWMPLHYIASAYAVPQAFLFDELGIEMTKANSGLPLSRLNSHLGLGTVNDQPALLAQVRTAIEKYHANPIVTGLIEGHVEPWMSIQYIANSTGIPAQYIFDQLGIPLEGNAYVPLDTLAHQLAEPKRVADLLAEVQMIVDAEGGVSP